MTDPFDTVRWALERHDPQSRQPVQDIRDALTALASIEERLREAEERAEVQCEKCGNEDVLVSWHRHTPNGAFQTECERNRSVLDNRAKSKDEHLHYHCRRCQYDWIGPVLAARGKDKK